MITDAIKKVTHPSVTSEEILTKVNQTADAIKKPKKMWTESDSSEIEGIFKYYVFLILST